MDASQLAQLVVGWQASGAGGLSQRLTLALRHVLATGVLADGQRLPTERALAVALDVSRPTVSAAIAELRSLGLVESRQGSGTIVTPRTGSSSAIDLASAAPFDASHLGSLTLDTANLLAVSPPSGVGPDGITVGLEALREHIARRHRRSGRPADAVNVLVTSGAHQALAMVIALRVPVGGLVLIEELTYDGLRPLVESLGVGFATVRRDHLGVDPSHLDTLINERRPDLVVLLGGVHSPTGVVSPAERVEQVAAVLDHHAMVVLVDGAGDDLAFQPPIHHLGASCEVAEVISVGTLSKSAWSGMQLGWIVTSEASVAQLARYRATALDHGPSIAAQLLAGQLLQRFDDLLDARRATLFDAARQFEVWFAEALPEWQVHTPDGGLTVWSALPGDDASGFVAALAAGGVSVRAGASSRPDGQPDPHLRLCFDRPPALLDEALDRIVEVWNARR
ncbi:MAG: PLP-dependent aminotransferase family protein [Acidimicrobiales bacterium]